MVPKGWKQTYISDLLDRVSNPVAVMPESEYHEIGIRSHGKGIFYKEAITGEMLGNKRVFHIVPDAFIVNIVFAWEQAVARTTANEVGMIASHRFPQYLPKGNACDVDYILYFFKTKKGKELLGLASPGGAGRNKTLGQKEFDRVQLTVPPLPEQRKIAKILSTWDKAITTTERLLANRQQQKKALMQRLLTGKQRFAGFEEEWCITTLGEVFSKITNGLTYDARATEGLPVTRIETISTGVVNYVKVGWAPANENTKRFRLQYGDILYSHINSLEHIGRVAFYRGEYPLYHGMNLLLLRPNDKVIPEFVYYVLNSQIGKRYAKLYAKAAVNQASISTTEIKTFKIKIPNKNEQQKIASVLSTSDAEITTIQNQLDNLKQQKKALMQQLLTGKRRVKVDSPALATQ